MFTDGQTVVYNHQGNETIVTNIDGTVYRQQGTAPGVVVEQLPALQQISQYFAESRQTVITRADLTVTTFVEDNNSEDTAPVSVTTEYPDGTKIFCKLDTKKVNKLLASFRNRTKSLVSNPEYIKKLLKETIQSVQVSFGSTFSAYFELSLGLSTVHLKPDVAFKIWAADKDVKMIEIVKMDGTLISFENLNGNEQRIRFKLPSFPTFNAVYAFTEQKHKHSAESSVFGSHLFFKDDKRLTYDVSLDSGRLKVYTSEEAIHFKVDSMGRLKVASKDATLRSMADMSAAVENITSSMSVMDLNALLLNNANNNNGSSSSSNNNLSNNNQITRAILTKDFPVTDPFPSSGPKLFIIRSDGTGIEFHRDLDLIPFTKEILREPDSHVIEQPLGHDSDAFSLTFIRKKVNNRRVFNEEYLVFRQAS